MAACDGPVTHSGAGPINVTEGHAVTTNNNTISGGSGNVQYIAPGAPSQEELDEKFRETLKITCPAVDRNELIDHKRERVPDTCEWILTTVKYTTWLREGTSQLLWVWGGPGKGKTMLSIFISQELEKTSKTTYFFCSAEGEERNTALAIIRGLLWQLTGLYPKLTRILRERLRSLSESALSSRKTLWTEFVGLLDVIKSDRCYWVIDGLDECDESSQQWLTEKLVALGSDDLTNDFKILVVSRDLINLRDSDQIRLDSDYSESVDRAVKTFIDVRTEALFHQISFDDELRDEVRRKLFKGAQGSFLWVGLAMIDVLKQKTKTGVMRVLRQLPAGLFLLYDRMLRNIDASQRMTSICILCCVSTVFRPLTLDELITMIRSWPQLELSVSKENIEDVLADCGPLFQVKTQTVRLVHESVRDYMKRGAFPDGFHLAPEQTHLLLARACIDALTQEAPGISILLPYATDFWPQHARESGTFAKDLLCHPSLFFSTKSRSRDIWWQSYLTSQPRSVSRYRVSTPLNLACLLGIEPWANDILSKVCTCSLVIFSVELLIRVLMAWMPVGVQDAQAMTALHFAAIGDREVIVKLLLDHGAAIDAENWDGQTALHLAAAGGREAVARLLLDRNANIHAEDWEGLTALHLASMKGYETTIKLLLEHGADIEYRNRYGATPLHCAARRGNRAAVELLLKFRADPNATTNISQERRTPLHYAASGGRRTVEVVKILLEQGAEVNARDSSGRTPLHLAIISRNKGLKNLSTLDETTFPSSRIPGQFPSLVVTLFDDQSGRLKIDCLRWELGSIRRNLWRSLGTIEIMRLLIEHQADVDIEEDWGDAVLTVQIAWGHGYVKGKFPMTSSRSMLQLRDNLEVKVPLALRFIARLKDNGATCTTDTMLSTVLY